MSKSIIFLILTFFLCGAASGAANIYSCVYSSQSHILTVTNLMVSGTGGHTYDVSIYLPDNAPWELRSAVPNNQGYQSSCAYGGFSSATFFPTNNLLEVSCPIIDGVKYQTARLTVTPGENVVLQSLVDSTGKELVTSPQPTNYAGTWTGPSGGYSFQYIVTQNGNSLTARIPLTGQYFTGQLNGTTAVFTEADSIGQGQATATLVSTNTVDLRIDSCSPSPGYMCVWPAGTVIRLTR